MPNVILLFDDFEFDKTWQELRRAGKVVSTPPVVMRLLEALLDAAPDVVSKEHLVARVWNEEPVGPNVPPVAIARARALVGHQRGVREVIASVRGDGYRILPPVVRSGGAIWERSASHADACRPPPPLVGRTRELGTCRA